MACDQHGPEHVQYFQSQLARPCLALRPKFSLSKSVVFLPKHTTHFHTNSPNRPPPLPVSIPLFYHFEILHSCLVSLPSPASHRRQHLTIAGQAKPSQWRYAWLPCQELIMDARGFRGIPAFREWNYGDDDDWSVLSQRFESAMHTQFPVHKPCKRARAGRRRRVEEWNNHSNGDGDSWTAAVNQCFEPVTAHKSLIQELTSYDNGVVAMGKQHKVARQTWVDDSGPHVAMEPFSFTAVKAVDDDLYEVPPDMPCAKPVRKGRMWLRSLLMRCCGINCFAH